MVFISAGFDAHSDDDMGSFTFTEADFAWITRQLKCWSKKNCNGHLVSVLEGGYDVDPLSRAATAHIRTLLDQEACSQAVQAAWKVLKALKKDLKFKSFFDFSGCLKRKTETPKKDTVIASIANGNAYAISLLWNEVQRTKWS